MNKEEILKKILDEKIVSIIRLPKAEQVGQVATALYEGGVSVIEVTMGTPNALKEIEKLAQMEGILAGVGSVVTATMAQEAIAAGAQFVVTPASKPEVIAMSHKYEKPVFSGALTPKEILEAYEWGADVVKLFPADTFGMPYFKAVKAPMPYIPLMPTGGVNLENAADWLKAGACALGLGSTLVNKNKVTDGDFEGITETARKMVAAVKLAC